ncbi:MAG: carboxypeptidase regulatory-like domain-containing protein [bacterium]
MSSRVVSMLALVCMCGLATLASAQTGVVMGQVTDANGLPVDSAYVTLSNGGCGGCQPDYATYTGPDGLYLLAEVDPDTYTAKARKRRVGKDTQTIEVAAGDTVEANFELTSCGGCPGDTLVTVDVEGYAIVDTNYCNRYYLDADSSGTADYKLNFGPPWYDPGSGATRPENGDYIYITGGLADWVTPPMIIVYEINGLWWRDPITYGHGGPGHGQGGHPDRAHISGTAPNPFNPETMISFELPEAGAVNLSVFNLRGEQVAKLVDGYRSAGEYQVNWNANQLSSGIYFVRLATGIDVAIKRVVLMK